MSNKTLGAAQPQPAAARSKSAKLCSRDDKKSDRTQLRPFTTFVRACGVSATSNAKHRSSSSRTTNDVFGYSISPAELRACDLQSCDALSGQPTAMRRIDSAHRLLQQQQQAQQKDRAKPVDRRTANSGRSGGDEPNARELYLSARKLASPREKYNFPEATSWRYGWVKSADLTLSASQPNLLH